MKPIGYVVWFLMLGTAYLFSIASGGRTELCYAALFAAAGTLVIAMLHRADRKSFTIGSRTLLILARQGVSGAVQESALLLGPRLWAQLTGCAPAGRYIRIGIDRGDGDAASEGRVAGVLWVQALTPNAIPLFIDNGQVVLHQLVHRREPNAGNRELPV